ncbi:MAG: hypothetical protein Greene101420_675 [Parcubacteria group bacterium Greene1014_20]|nr:MAG: hypothetical protein Greene041636_667 [Parcubacteria group bacterium Greene0416_36]TSC98623.1 MAG: hypothetical protein Greene101420_675 [Parcubacteria group bacterium Greene1014_20]
MESYFGDLNWVRWIFQHALAGIYLVAFISAWKQFPALLGEKGLLPAFQFVKRASFWQSPSIFHWHYSDRFLRALAILGAALSAAVLLGLPDQGSWWLSMGIWLALWFIYLSIVNVGQVFYAFGWESMLLEAGCFAAFLGPASWQTPIIPILILRWMLFRTELGAGLIKLRHDECWQKLTCLFYHYETQPLPNPLSWYFHHFPKIIHQFSILFSHFVQIIVPFGLFAPQPIAGICGGLIIFHQFWLIVSGNYSWLNWLTIVLGITALNDAQLGFFLPLSTIASGSAIPHFYNLILLALAGVTTLLSIQPILNLFSRNQLMNYSYNPFHLVNTYGAFGSVTQKRYEIILEGTDSPILSAGSQWKEYEWKGKPGNIQRTPPQVAPYHLRLDWLMWFLPFSVKITDKKIKMYGYEPWFINFVQKLLRGDPQIIKLLGTNPFPESPPSFIRAQFYRYQFTTPEEKKQTGAWWKREHIGEYLPPVSSNSFL